MLGDLFIGVPQLIKDLATKDGKWDLETEDWNMGKKVTTLTLDA